MEKQAKKRKVPALLKKSSVSGTLRLDLQDGNILGESRVRLLLAIDSVGSISGAAREIGISYKTAWDSVDDMNNLAGTPMVLTATGGERGGGARLSDEAKRLIEVYNIIQKEHNEFLNRLSTGIKDFDRYYKFLRRISMKTSARNQFHGSVARIQRGAVNSVITLHLQGNDTITAVITNDSVDSLGLQPGSSAYAIIKATQVLLATQPVKSSARNNIVGMIRDMKEGPVNVEVNLLLEGGTVLTAMITQEAKTDLGLKVGMQAWALFKASSVILGVHG